MTDEPSDLSPRELAAETMIARLMDSIEAGDRHLTANIVKWHPVDDLPIVVLALAGMLLVQEAANEELRPLEAGNKALFEERAELTAKVVALTAAAGKLATEVDALTKEARLLKVALTAAKREAAEAKAELAPALEKITQLQGDLYLANQRKDTA